MITTADLATRQLMITTADLATRQLMITTADLATRQLMILTADLATRRLMILTADLATRQLSSVKALMMMMMDALPLHLLRRETEKMKIIFLRRYSRRSFWSVVTVET